MNDRFRFRVWNKHINEYCNIQNLFILPTGETGYFITDGSYPHQRKFMHQEDMIIEQCTGLKDKNGKLIFENDIIIAPNNSHKLIVIRMKNGVYGCKEYRFNGVWEMNLYDLIKHYGVEIIGNIHEQAEQKD